MTLTKDSPWKDVVDHFKAQGYCEATAEAYNDKLLKDNPTITFEEVVNKHGVDPELDPVWYIWVMASSASSYWSEFDAEMQKLHMDKVFTHALLLTTDGFYAARALKEIYARWTPQQQTSLLNKAQAASISPSSSEEQVTNIFISICEYLDVANRPIALGKITDPMLAFRVYLEVADLTDQEDALLEAKFTGLLPTSEKELEDSVIERAKPTAIILEP